MSKSIKRRLLVGVAAAGLLLSMALGVAHDASASGWPAVETQSISWCQKC